MECSWVSIFSLEKERLDFKSVAHEGYEALSSFSSYVKNCGLDQRLLELIKTRVSQINGCAYCIDLHTKRARALGETEQRLYALPAWKDTSFFSKRECAALEWAEAVTNVASSRVPNEVYDIVRSEFSEKEIVDLTLCTIAINGQNRIAISFRKAPGSQ
jgi:AhpD family alkylhydroperoxidase